MGAEFIAEIIGGIDPFHGLLVVVVLYILKKKENGNGNHAQIYSTKDDLFKVKSDLIKRDDDRDARFEDKLTRHDDGNIESFKQVDKKFDAVRDDIKTQRVESNKNFGRVFEVLDELRGKR